MCLSLSLAVTMKRIQPEFVKMLPRRVDPIDLSTNPWVTRDRVNEALKEKFVNTVERVLGNKILHAEVCTTDCPNQEQYEEHVATWSATYERAIQSLTEWHKQHPARLADERLLVLLLNVIEGAPTFDAGRTEERRKQSAGASSSSSSRRCNSHGTIRGTI